MFIRKIRTRTTASGESYFSHRLVASQREGDKVRQKTLLNLGRHFPIDQGDWPLLCPRVDERMTHQATLNFMTLPTEIEAEARRIAKRLLERQDCSLGTPDWETVDLQSVQNSDARSIGIEHAALEALKLLDLPNTLCALGLNKRQQGCALANIIGRRTQPGSERATNAWLRTSSATGELLGIDFGALSDRTLYRASDHLFKHKKVREDHRIGTVETLFNLQPVVTLYDLTNTSFAGEAAGPPKAKHGHSKERRSDAPLLTLGAVLDSSGFLRRTAIFPGNVVEAHTLETMLTALEVPKGGIVVMDRMDRGGIATEENRAWMRAQGYIYLVVSRSPTRVFDPEVATTTVTTAGQEEIAVYRDCVESREEDATPYTEVLLRCHSIAREKKEMGLITHFQDRFEEGLRALHDGLSKPRTRKTLPYVQRKIGQLQKENAVVAQHYDITVTPDPANKRAVALAWELKPSDGSMLQKPGVYSLRSNCLDWDAEAMWKTYAMLTDTDDPGESVFRSLKSELGLRPIYHPEGSPRGWTSLHLRHRLTAAIQVLRTRRTQTGLTASWTTIRNALRTLPRITTAFARPASTPGPPGAYPQHGTPECRSGRDLPGDADRTPGPESAQDDRLNPLESADKRSHKNPENQSLVCHHIF